MQQQPFAWGRQEDFDAAANQENHYCLGKESHCEPLAHDTTVGNQGIRMRFGAFRNWSKNWAGVYQPGASGSASTGVSCNFGGSSVNSRLNGAKPHILLAKPRVTMSISGGTWLASSRNLIKTGAFAAYTWQSGDRIWITGGTGHTVGWYTITSKNSNDDITLAAHSALSTNNNADTATSSIGDPETQLDTARCNDVFYYGSFSSDKATDASIDTTDSFGWLFNASPASGLYKSGSLWFNGVAMRARMLVFQTTSPATLRLVSQRAGNTVNSGDYVHPGTGDVLQNVDVGVFDSAGGGDIRAYIRGGSLDETGKTFCCGGFWFYKYDATRPLNLATGSTFNTVSHAGWNDQNWVDRITEDALYLHYKNTVPPSVILDMSGHNRTSAELADLDGANDGTVLNNLITVAQRQLNAAERAKRALGVSYKTRYFYCTPWLASASAGLSTVARGVALRNRQITAAKSVGANVMSLFDFFNQANPLMNTSMLHADAVQASGDGPNCDIRTIANAIMAIWGSRVPVLPLRIPRP